MAIVKHINNTTTANRDASLYQSCIFLTLHYAARAMGAMTLRISELCLSFSPHPNISDGNVNLVHHFFRIQIFQINGKGPS